MGRPRALRQPSSVTIDGTRLVVVVGRAYASRHVFDLATARVTAVGTPGARGWRVLFERRALAPYVIDDDVVGDPQALVAALTELCPQLRTVPAGAGRRRA